MSDPVPADHASVVGGGSPLEDATTALDDRRRTYVVIVADDQRPFDPFLTTEPNRLVQDLCGIAVTPKRRHDAVPDMTTFTGEPVVELESNGDPTDELSVDIRSEERRTDLARGSSIPARMRSVSRIQSSQGIPSP